MKPLRVLVLSHVFAPYNTVGAVRVGKLASHWHQLGLDVRVVTACEPAADWLDCSLPLGLPPERVDAVRFVDPNRLGMAALRTLLAMRPRKQAASDTGRAYVGSLAALPPLLRAPAFLYTTLVNLPDRAVGWIGPALWASHHLLQRWRPEVIFASGGPFSTLVAAAILGRQTGIPVVMDLRDLWTGNSIYPPRPGRVRLERALERWTLQTATALTSTTEAWVEHLRVQYSKPTYLIYNGFAQEDLPEPAPAAASAPLQLVFTGRLYGALANMTPLLQALAQTPDLRVQVSCYVRDDPRPLQAQVDQLGLYSRVAVLPPVPYAAALQAQVDADALVLPTFADRHIYTAKLFEYVGARRPILTLGDDGHLAVQLVVQRGLGLGSTHPTTIASWLQTLAQRKAAGDDLRLPAGACADLSRAAQAQTLAEILQQAAAQRSS